MNRASYRAAAVIAAVCILFYWKLALSSEYVWFDHPDMCYIEIPRLNFEAREIHQGRFPLWDPGIWMGQPLLGQTQPGPVFPLNLLFLLLPLRDGYIEFRLLNWYYVVARLIAALAAYALCRDLRRSRPASIAAAFAFAFGGFIGTVAWLDVFNGAVWTPAICLFFLRSARGIRPGGNAALSGFFLGCAWLSGHHEIPLLISYALAAGWTFTIWRRRTIQVLAPAVTTFILAGLIAAVQLWPTAEFARRSERWVGLERSVSWDDAISYTIPAIYSLPARALPGIAIDSAGRHADAAAFLGIVIVALSLFAIAASWRHPVVRWMACLAAISTVYALGDGTPLHGLLYTWVPMLGKARIPARAIHLLNFALVVLAAYGMDVLLAHRARHQARLLTRVLTGTAAVIFLASLFRTDLADGFALAGIVALLFAATIHAWTHARVSYAFFAASVICLMLMELYPVSTRTFTSSYAKDGRKFVRSLTDNRDIADFLRNEPSPRRVAVNDADIPTNFADWHGFDGYEGYVAGVTANLLQIPRHTRAVQNLYGVTHYVSREPVGAGWQEVFLGQTGVKVFRNPEALPRVWSVHAVQRISSRSQLNGHLSQNGFDPRRTALVVGDAPSVQSCEGDEVRLLSRAPNRIQVQVRMNCRGLLVMSETWYPGWIATVDGRETAVLEIFGALRGVVVDAGEHSVELVYRPVSVYAGATLTATGLLLTLVAVARNLVRGSPVRALQ